MASGGTASTPRGCSPGPAGPLTRGACCAALCATARCGSPLPRSRCRPGNTPCPRCPSSSPRGSVTSRAGPAWPSSEPCSRASARRNAWPRGVPRPVPPRRTPGPRPCRGMGAPRLWWPDAQPSSGTTSPTSRAPAAISRSTRSWRLWPTKARGSPCPPKPAATPRPMTPGSMPGPRSIVWRVSPCRPSRGSQQPPPWSSSGRSARTCPGGRVSTTAGAGGGGGPHPSARGGKCGRGGGAPARIASPSPGALRPAVGTTPSVPWAPFSGVCRHGSGPPRPSRPPPIRGRAWSRAGSNTAVPLSTRAWTPTKRRPASGRAPPWPDKPRPEALPWCPSHLREHTVRHGCAVRHRRPHVCSGSWTPRVARARAEGRAHSLATEGRPCQEGLHRLLPPLKPPLTVRPNHPTS
jgi:hypothetical protein